MLSCFISFFFHQIQVPLLAPAPLTHLSHRPVPVPYMSWVATPKLAVASPPAVSLHHHWPASLLLSPCLRSALHPASPVTPNLYTASMARHCPLPPSLAILCVHAVQNRHAHRSSRGSSQQRSWQETRRHTTEIGRPTAPAATPWRCLCPRERGWRTWRATPPPGSSVSASTAVRGCT